jgi:hypothetical protein
MTILPPPTRSLRTGFKKCFLSAFYLSLSLLAIFLAFFSSCKKKERQGVVSLNKYEGVVSYNAFLHAWVVNNSLYMLKPREVSACDRPLDVYLSKGGFSLSIKASIQDELIVVDNINKVDYANSKVERLECFDADNAMDSWRVIHKGAGNIIKILNQNTSISTNTWTYLYEGLATYVPDSEQLFLLKAKMGFTEEETKHKIAAVQEPFLVVYEDKQGGQKVLGGYVGKDYFNLVKNPVGLVNDLYKNMLYVLGTKAYSKLDRKGNATTLLICNNELRSTYSISSINQEYKVTLSQEAYTHLTKNGKDFTVTLFDSEIAGYVGSLAQVFSERDFKFSHWAEIKDKGIVALSNATLLVQINGLNTCIKPEVATVVSVENFPAELIGFKFSQNGVEIAPEWIGVSVENRNVSIQAIPGKGDVRMHYVEAGICNYIYYNHLSKNARFFDEGKSKEIYNPLPCNRVASVYQSSELNGVLIAKSADIKESATIAMGTVRAKDLQKTQNQDYTVWVSGIRVESALTVLSASQQGNATISGAPLIQPAIPAVGTTGTVQINKVNQRLFLANTPARVKLKTTAKSVTWNRVGVNIESATGDFDLDVTKDDVANGVILALESELGNVSNYTFAFGYLSSTADLTDLVVLQKDDATGTGENKRLLAQYDNSKRIITLSGAYAELLNKKSKIDFVSAKANNNASVALVNKNTGSKITEIWDGGADLSVSSNTVLRITAEDGTEINYTFAVVQVLGIEAQITSIGAEAITPTCQGVCPAIKPEVTLTGTNIEITKLSLLASAYALNTTSDKFVYKGEQILYSFDGVDFTSLIPSAQFNFAQIVSGVANLLVKKIRVLSEDRRVQANYDITTTFLNAENRIKQAYLNREFFANLRVSAADEIEDHLTGYASFNYGGRITATIAHTEPNAGTITFTEEGISLSRAPVLFHRELILEGTKSTVLTPGFTFLQFADFWFSPSSPFNELPTSISVQSEAGTIRTYSCIDNIDYFMSEVAPELSSFVITNTLVGTETFDVSTFVSSTKLLATVDGIDLTYTIYKYPSRISMKSNNTPTITINYGNTVGVGSSLNATSVSYATYTNSALNLFYDLQFYSNILTFIPSGSSTISYPNSAIGEKSLYIRTQSEDMLSMNIYVIPLSFQ